MGNQICCAVSKIKEKCIGACFVIYISRTIIKSNIQFYSCSFHICSVEKMEPYQTTHILIQQNKEPSLGFSCFLFGLGMPTFRKTQSNLDFSKSTLPPKYPKNKDFFVEHFPEKIHKYIAFGREGGGCWLNIN